MPARKNPRPAPKSFYLGDRETADQRCLALDELAKTLGLTGRSVLIQQIADGALVVSKAPRPERVPVPLS